MLIQKLLFCWNTLTRHLMAEHNMNKLMILESCFQIDNTSRELI